MIGTSASGLITLFQAEANDILKETRGDMGKIVTVIVQRLHQQDLLSEHDAQRLRASFAEALDVLAGKQSADAALESSRRRLIELTGAGGSADLARVLGELCHSVIVDAALKPRLSVGGVTADPESAVLDPTAIDGGLPPAVAATVSGKGPQAILWGAIGAYVGGSIGGPLGAVIGAGVGAAVGACGDSDTTITPTNNGGNPA